MLPMRRLQEFEGIFTLKDSSYTLVQVGFHTQLYLLDEARRKGVVTDDGEEDEELDYANIIAQYGAFHDDAMGEIMKKMRQRQKTWQLMLMLLVIVDTSNTT